MRRQQMAMRKQRNEAKPAPIAEEAEEEEEEGDDEGATAPRIEQAEQEDEAQAAIFNQVEAVAKHQTEKIFATAMPANVVASHSGLQMERVERERLSKRACANKMKALEMSPLKRGMPKAFEPYREERRKLLFSNLPATFQSRDAPPIVEGEQEQSPSDDPIQDQVEHFLFDKILFFKYCMIEGHSALQSGSRQKSMDLHEFLHMAMEIGALRDSKNNVKNAGGGGRIPVVHGLERNLLTKRQAANCFRAAMAKATTQTVIASGELTFELYKIASRLLAKIFVHGEPRVEEELGGKKGGRASCPPSIPLVAPAHSSTEIYAKIVEKLVRPRPNGADQLLDEVEDLMFNPEIFERFCAITGHSDLQSGSRRSTMDQFEWLRCLTDLGLMPPDQIRQNRDKIVDPYLQKKEKKKTAPDYPSVVEKLERRLSKEQAVNTFRRALGKATSKHTAPVGELNFRRYCVAVQIVAKLLVNGEDNPYPEERKVEGEGTISGKNRRRVVELRVKKRKGALELPEWDARFSVPSSKRPPEVAAEQNEASSNAKVVFNLSSDVTQASVERALSEKSMELAELGDRAMLREEFCSRFATRDAFSKHGQKRDKDAREASHPSILSPTAALQESVVDTLQKAHLVPDFVSREALLEMLTNTQVDASDETATISSPTKSVSFGRDSREAAAFTHEHVGANPSGTFAHAGATRRGQSNGGKAETLGGKMSSNKVSDTGLPLLSDEEASKACTSEAGSSSSIGAQQGKQASSSVRIRGNVAEVLSATQETDNVRESIQGAYGALLWPYAAFRTSFERLADKIDVEALKAFLQSPHAWCHVPTSYDYCSNAKNGRKQAHRKQMPQTPWTQAHPTASYRPRTSVRVLMLNQKELRRQHMQAQQKRQHAQVIRLEKLKVELEKREKIEMVKESKRQRWQDALNQVDAKIGELKQEKERLQVRQRNRKATMAQALDEAEQHLRISCEDMPAYTRLPAITKGHSRSLSQHLGFDSLKISHDDDHLNDSL